MLLGSRRLVGLLAAVVLLAAGCGIGRNKTLFFTTANVGLNVDSAPPTAELTISRRENVIGPSLEGGVKLPVLASFQSRFAGLLGVGADVSSTFAGGDAAETMARLFDDPDTPTVPAAADSTRCVSSRPGPDGVDEPGHVAGPGEVRPFVFGTDTSFGLKVAWSGATAQYPDSVKLGYNRKEWALAAVSTRPASAVSGTVRAVDASGDPTVVALADGRLYAITGRTMIVRGGQPVALGAVRAGDVIALYATYPVTGTSGAYTRAAATLDAPAAPCAWGEWEVHMPSFVATIDHHTSLTTPGESGIDHTQLFATGAAATDLVRRRAVRDVMLHRLDPKTAEAARALRSFKSDQSAQIATVNGVQQAFAAADDATKAKILDRARALGLVPPDTTTAAFARQLSAAVDGNDPKATARLGVLEAFAKHPQ